MGLDIWFPDDLANQTSAVVSFLERERRMMEFIEDNFGGTPGAKLLRTVLQMGIHSSLILKEEMIGNTPPPEAISAYAAGEREIRALVQTFNRDFPPIQGTEISAVQMFMGNSPRILESR